MAIKKITTQTTLNDFNTKRKLKKAPSVSAPTGAKKIQNNKSKASTPKVANSVMKTPKGTTAKPKVETLPYNGKSKKMKLL